MSMEDMEERNEFPEEIEETEVALPTEQPDVKKVGGYRALAIVLFALSLGGLFFGALASKSSVFLQPMFAPISTGGLNGSIVVGIYHALKNAGTVLGGGKIFESPELTLPLQNALVLGVSMFVALVLTVVCLASRKYAEHCMRGVAICMLVGYGFLALTTMGLFGYYGLRAHDIIAIVLAGVAFIALFVCVIVQKRKKGILNAIMLLLSVVTGIMFALPNSPYVALYFVSCTNQEISTIFPLIASLLVITALEINLLSSCVRASAKRFYVYDLIRYILLLSSFALVIVSAYVPKSNAYQLFSVRTILPAILPIILTFILLLLSIVGIAKEEKPTADGNEEETQELVLPEEASDEAQDAQETEGMDAVLQEIDAMASQEKTPSPSQEDGTKERSISEFERMMAELAKSQPAVPVETPMKKTEPEQMTIPVKGDTVYVSNYLVQSYDPFIATLTPNELTEFGNLFISKKSPVLAYMPAYVVGGENKEFFSQVFIHLGRFRNGISDDLLNKIYKYVNS